MSNSSNRNLSTSFHDSYSFLPYPAPTQQIQIRVISKVLKHRHEIHLFELSYHILAQWMILENMPKDATYARITRFFVLILSGAGQTFWQLYVIDIYQRHFHLHPCHVISIQKVHIG